ncbi:MAG TPA: flavin oxidoreductase [Bacteroidetes bacterium]|jgi:flavin reductase (DIM6/NTAB) family NADH-FMN oxidoreductase RutF|nr:MAG: flavin oxidoreductase [Sphingobacteriales bacterium BACL12 MAG-120802-bin5]KRP11933.1 MAG: flavin oxidoreductase [Sphingobacteriales bacterium BACL12 MAG-120813-bin55]HCK21184.1 flavin oxidoreductase [Bacteroidota bacterium]
MIWKKEDIKLLEKRYRAAFINSLSGFKSANLIGTRSIEAHTNLSIVSSAIHLGSDPALMGIIFRPDIVERHTLENIRSTGFFTMNHVGASFYDKAHQTSARYDRSVSEFDACGLGLEYIDQFFAPFVKEAAIKMGLQFKEEISIKSNGTSMIVGQITIVQFPDKLVAPDGYLDIEKAGTIAISGLDSYHTTRRMDRLSYAKADSLPQPLRFDTTQSI